jgi:hypothetical protein
VTPTPTPRPPLPQDPIIDEVPTDDPCALPVTASFDGSSVVVGAPIVAIPEGGRVAIFTGADQIGWLPDDVGEGIRACAGRGWAYSGEVTSVADDVITVTLAATRLQ